jgi:hypothetical protein
MFAEMPLFAKPKLHLSIESVFEIHTPRPILEAINRTICCTVLLIEQVTRESFGFPERQITDEVSHANSV